MKIDIDDCLLLKSLILWKIQIGQKFPVFVYMSDWGGPMVNVSAGVWVMQKKMKKKKKKLEDLWYLIWPLETTQF